MSLEELVIALKKLNGSVYHFTDLRNLPSIRENGLLSMAEIRRREIETVPGGNQWSQDADLRFGMDEYVHLCFFKDHPMEYYAKKEGRIENVKYLRIDPEIILHRGALITDQVSNKSAVKPLPAQEMFDKIDWTVLYTRTDWKKPEIQARLRIAQKCELLVPSVVENTLIRNLQ
jgi:hypothetical protein